ncbi:hypothetical protein [Kitasatospora cineracea]|uniref:hypothetical protein n=1 Tax=Kitasatospora cineracea TaxID=88074 RepID=UPI0036768C75
MRLAPLPQHGRVNDPAWQAMYATYEPLITPLRRRQLTVDIDFCGPAAVLYAELPDGTFLRIGTNTPDGGLPSHIDNVASWLVVREDADNPTVRHAVYDSTPDDRNVYGTAGGLIAPLLNTIDALLRVRRMPGGPSDHRAVITLTTIHETGPASFATTLPFANATIAADRHTELLDALTDQGLTIAHQTGFGPWRKHVLAAGDRIQVLTTTLAELVPGGRGDLACFCVLTHPQTPEDDARLLAEAEHAHRIGDAHGVFLAMQRLYTASGCPARPKGYARV